MALVKCEECKNEVSNKADKCPNCGVKIKQGKGCLWWIGVLFVVIAVGYGIEVSTKDTSGSNTTSTQGSTSDLFLVYRYAEDAVKKDLKSPTTAEFPGRSERVNHVNYLGDGEYKVNSWVDSQNSFGAIIRTNFSVVIVMIDGSISSRNLIFE